jgi:hypothetical protein
VFGWATAGFAVEGENAMIAQARRRAVIRERR